jgi:type II secretory pathway component PulM
MKDAIRDWFENRPPHERAILVGVAVAVLLAVLWLGALRPLQSGSAVLRESVAAKQRLLANLSQIGGQDTAPGGTTPGGDQTLLRLVKNSAVEHGVETTRERADGPNGLQVTFGNASFDTLVEWIVALETQNAVIVESASFTVTRQPGIVNGQLLLRRP